jgi:hypothetical protein
MTIDLDKLRRDIAGAGDGPLRVSPAWLKGVVTALERGRRAEVELAGLKTEAAVRQAVGA